MIKLIAIAGFVFAAAGCAQPIPKAAPLEAKQEKAYTACPEQRSQMCTRIYQAVCASRDTGIRCVAAPCPSSEQRTYSNACEACADAKVLGHVPGSCEEKKN